MSFDIGYIEPENIKVITGQLGDDWMDAACKMTRVTALMRGTIRFPYQMEL